MLVAESGDLTPTCVLLPGVWRAQYYIVSVEAGTSKWQVEKRYSEFRSLRKQLRAEAPATPMPDFPSKQRMATVFQKVSVEERRAKLESFLRACVEVPDFQGVTLACFLDPVLDRQLHGALPVRSALVLHAGVRGMNGVAAVTGVGCAICWRGRPGRRDDDFVEAGDATRCSPLCNLRNASKRCATSGATGSFYASQMHQKQTQIFRNTRHHISPGGLRTGAASCAKTVTPRPTPCPVLHGPNLACS